MPAAKQHAHLPAEVAAALKQLHTELRHINRKADHIMATQQDAAAQLATTGTKLDKISGETTSLIAEIQKLKDAAGAAGTVSPDLQAAIDAVSSKADAIDAQVDDVAPNPTPTPPPMSMGSRKR